MFAQTSEGVEQARAEEKELAVAECERLAAALTQSDPVKAAELDAATKDEKLGAYEIYALVKNDGRDAKPVEETEPTKDETPTKGDAIATKDPP